MKWFYMLLLISIGSPLFAQLSKTDIEHYLGEASGRGYIFVPGTGRFTYMGTQSAETTMMRRQKSTRHFLGLFRLTTFPLLYYPIY